MLRLALLPGLLLSGVAAAHGVADDDRMFIEGSAGLQLLPFLYLGAKHMVTGYDHLLFLFGVIFFLYRLKEVGLYVTLFAIGHSSTLLFGVLSGTHVNPYLVDAIIGLSVVYKALDNLGAFKTWFGVQPNTKAAVLIFGFFHGFGLATKLQDFQLSADGLVPNMLAFNVGVELGQLLALAAILIVMGFWRRSSLFARQAFAANALLMTAGFVLAGYQLVGYFQS
ncbi:HupE/UreJ family protein [uncultured Nevskia sp.]|uniref:HupE/UreJ family protein n=1 Tax=uncultured Nevskia sp. TaxID=228950 RepID=UPI0025E16D3A|nr:HupE/UreJ family protein [uncultured Nevskia sp.]